MPRLTFALVALIALGTPSAAQIVADFSASPTTVAAGDTVTFTDLTTGGLVFAQQWDFGDGAQAVSTEPTIDHTYDTAGVYTVSLTIVGLPANDTEVKTDFITVTPASLVPDFTATPSSGPVLLAVQFTDTTGGAGTPTSWSWDFGDGSTSTFQDPIHIYTAPGTYDVSLEVSSGGDSWSVVKPGAVVVDPAVYTPDFIAAPTSGTVPLDVSFTDATTGVAKPTSFLWSFGDGGTSPVQDSVHTYTTPGTYSVTLTAFVGQQAEAVTKTDFVVVDPVPLVADLSASPTSGPVPLTVDFTDASTGTPPTSWLWDFGDGSTSTEQDPQHVYEFPGTYTVTLSVGYFGQTETVVAEDLVQIDHLATLHVPGDAPTIQAAVDMAGPFTEILVAPGTWHEAVTLGTGPVALRGTGGAAATILDASGTGLPVVRAASGTLPGTTLRGLTITGGSSANGGGLRVDTNATVTLRECIVRDNASTGDGGGVFVADGNADVTLIDCVVRDNTADVDGGGVAIEGGLFFVPPNSSLLLERCAFVRNTSGGSGGGTTAGTARDCVYVENEAGALGGGAARTSAEGCTFLANSAGSNGGGLFDYAQSFTFFANVSVSDCVFVDNVAPEGGGLALSASAELATQIDVSDCVFAGNSASVGAALFSAPTPGTTIVERCTFVGDTLRSVGDGLVVRNSIVRAGPTPFETSDVDLVEYSNIEGGWPGVGNFDADPLFVDADAHAYGLRPGSPCIDAGNPESPLDADGTIADVGALPFTSIHDVGTPLYGENGLPSLSADGTLAPGAPFTLSIARGPSSGSATLVIGAFALSAPLKGGVLVPQPLDLVPGLPLDDDGDVTLPGSWPAGLPTGTTVWLQAWSADPAGPKGFSATNGLALVQP